MVATVARYPFGPKRWPYPGVPGYSPEGMPGRPPEGCGAPAGRPTTGHPTSGIPVLAVRYRADWAIKPPEPEPWAPDPPGGRPMQAEVKGSTLPLLEMVLEPGESVISAHGELSWMSSNVQLTQTTNAGGQKGIMSGLKRAVGGGGIFLTKYEAQGGQGMVAFGAKLPGRIFPVTIAARAGLSGPSARLGLRHRRHRADQSACSRPSGEACMAATGSSSSASRVRARPGSSCPERSPTTSWPPARRCWSIPDMSGCSRTG